MLKLKSQEAVQFTELQVQDRRKSKKKKKRFHKHIPHVEKTVSEALFTLLLHFKQGGVTVQSQSSDPGTVCPTLLPTIPCPVSAALE